MQRQTYRAIALAALMVMSMIAIGAAPAAAFASAGDESGPPDHAEIPEDRVEIVDERSGPPAGPGPPEFAEDLVPSSSVNAEGMDVEIILRDSGPEFSLTDESESDAREISVDRDALLEALDADELPDRVYGEHSSGDWWSSELEVKDDEVVFETREFSTNNVTFVGEVSIDAEPAVDGDLFEYEVASGEEVEDAELVYTGHDSTSAESRSWSGLEDSDSVSFDVEGSTSVDLTVEMSSGGGGGEQSWTYENIDFEILDVAIDESEELVYIVGENGAFEAIDFDGSHEWTYDDTSASDIDAVAVDESTGTVYATVGSTEFHAVDGSTADKHWVYDDHDDFGNPTSLVVDESRGTVYSGDGNGEVHAVDADPSQTDPTKEWVYDEHDNSVKGIDVDESSGTIYAGDDSAELHAIDENGNQEWVYGQPSNVWAVAVDESSATVYSGDANGEVHAVDADPSQTDPTKEWVYDEHTDAVHGLVVDQSDGVVYSASRDTDVHAVDADPSQTDPTKEWIYDEHTDWVNGLGLADGDEMLFSGSDDEELHAIDVTGAAVDPSITIDGETVSYDGELGDEETHSETITVSTGSYTESISLSDGAADVNISWTEVTETIDPEVEISSDDGTQTVGGDSVGTLSDGVTVDVSDSIDESLIDGNVSVSVSVSEEIDGPVGKVGLEYSHELDDVRSVSYQGEQFSERYNVTKLWEHDRDDAELRIPWASERVIELRSIVVEHDHGGHTSVDEDPDYSFDDGEVVVEIGDVEEDDETTVIANGSKVSVNDGTELRVTKPTDKGQELDTEIEIVEVPDDDPVEIDVSGVEIVEEDERMIWVDDESWTDADPHSEIRPSEQVLVLDAPAGSTARLYTTDIGADIDHGAAEVRPLNERGDRLYVNITDGTGPVYVVYHDTVLGDWYRIVEDGTSRVIDEDEASSPVRFALPQSGIFEIEGFEPEAAVSAATTAATTAVEDRFLPPWAILILTITGSMIALTIVTRRIGTTDQRAGFLPIVIGGFVIGGIGVELATARDLSSELLAMIGGLIGMAIEGTFGAFRDIVGGLIAGLAGGLASPEFGALIVAIGILLAILWIDQATDLEVPLPGYIIVGGFVLVWLLEAISEGAVLERLGPGLEEVSPLVWLILLVGGFVTIWLWLRARRPEFRIITERGGDDL